MKHLACIRGVIGYWSYYSTVMKVRDIVENNTIVTVAQSDELYTSTINEILQREINSQRIGQISNYILNNDERFFSSLIVAFHRGEPRWTEIDINNNFEVDNATIDEDSITFLSNKFGVLTLTGTEEIFALDGQHRLEGIRDAYAKNPDIGNLEIALTFVIHKHEFKERTRRLFTVLNKYAEKPKGAELIILDEDDAAAVNARRLVTEHAVLSLPHALSNSKTGAIGNNDFRSFTTLVTLHKINRILYPVGNYNIRPTGEVLENLFTLSSAFWNSIFEAFPELIEYINGNAEVMIGDSRINRNDESGGSLLLRPAGQEILAQAFNKFSAEERPIFIQKLQLTNFNLSSPNWRYIFWNDKMLGKEARLKNNLLLYMLGKYDNADNIHAEMNRVYNLHNENYENHITPVDL